MVVDGEKVGVVELCCELVGFVGCIVDFDEW